MHEQKNVITDTLFSQYIRGHQWYNTSLYIHLYMIGNIQSNGRCNRALLGKLKQIEHAHQGEWHDQSVIKINL